MTTPIEDQLDEILLILNTRCPKCDDEGHGGDGCKYCWSHNVEKIAIDKTKTKLINLFAHLASEAKPEFNRDDFSLVGCEKHWSDDTGKECTCDDTVIAVERGHNEAIDTYHQNFLRLIGRAK